jgi:hypothetical protein
LCFKCGDKFAPGHKCTKKESGNGSTQLSSLESESDKGDFLPEELLNALELQVMLSGEDCFLSLNAIFESQSTKVIHLRPLVNNQVLSILVDSGSSHTFLNSAMLTRVECNVVPTTCMPVRVANGQTVLSDKAIHGFEWWIHGLTFLVDARVLDIAAYDLILGMDWLELYRPMTCDWLLKWIQFEYQGSMVTLQGIVPS